MIPRPSFLGTPAGIVRSMIVNRTILRQLIRRDIHSRYRKSALGMLWALLTPLLTFAVYAYVFSAILAIRFPSRVPDVEHNYGIVLFSGLMLHFFVTEVLTRSPTLILENVNFVKKVVFPLETLSVVAVGSAVVTLGFNLVVLLLALLAFEASIPLYTLLVPVVWSCGACCHRSAASRSTARCPAR
jgi:lipopolysaccharide transport system permease protein